MDKVLFKLEGLSMVVVAIYFYAYMDFSWIAFFLLLLVPDISKIGFLYGKRIGSMAYNLFHTYIVPMLLIIIGLAVHDAILMIGLIWVAHIGMDRVLGRLAVAG
ncbi:DUF4260 family protein [Ammoniphilus sp. YIM 78166]|uniref:DUF4260 family protein n=1 Tax=Ammoniphilus sp. YIM 78166 TaxID=1644106 RepID=UPI00106FF29B|nr:DUF4260 family protein [Ammoniphilus sp. YIM 78166]